MAREFDDASSEDLSTTTLAITGLPFTCQCWFKLHDHSGAGKTILSMGDMTAANDYWTIFVPTSGILRFRTRSGGSGGNADTSNEVTDGTWHHAHVHFYANGNTECVLDGTVGSKGTNTSQSYPSSQTQFRIGSRTASGTKFYMDGEVAEVMMSGSYVGSARASLGANALMHRGASFPVFYAPLIRDEDTDRIKGISMTANNSPTVSAHPRIIYPGPHMTPFSQSSTKSHWFYRAAAGVA